MPTSLGKRVRKLRLKCNLTLEGLAKRAGASKSYIWEIENKDVVRPSAGKLHQIAAALNTTIDYLIAAGEVTEADAADAAFFRKYQKTKPENKVRLRKMLRILDGKDE